MLERNDIGISIFTGDNIYLSDNYANLSASYGFAFNSMNNSRIEGNFAYNYTNFVELGLGYYFKESSGNFISQNVAYGFSTGFEI